MINRIVIASSQNHKIPSSCDSRLPALLDVCFTLSWPSALSQITFEPSLNSLICGFLWRGPPNFHWTGGWLEIFHITAGTSCYISRVFAYSEKPEGEFLTPQYHQTSSNTRIFISCLFSLQTVLPSALSPCGSMTARCKRLPTSGWVWVLTGGGWTSRWV